MNKPFYIGPTPPRRMWPGDFAAIAAEYKVPEATLRAVCEVESSGKGLHTSGAVSALYEPHVAYRNTSGAMRDRLVRAGLAYEKWKRSYPKSSYPRIDQCAKIAGIEVACRSSSWGLPQILGENYADAGYKSAEEMVRDFTKGEPGQVRAMIRFIKADRDMWFAMLNHDWAAFAYRYNGPGYRANAYDTKLAEAHKKWSKRLGTTIVSTTAPGPMPPAPTRELKKDLEKEYDDTEQHWLTRLLHKVMDLF